MTTGISYVDETWNQDAHSRNLLSGEGSPDGLRFRLEASGNDDLLVLEFRTEGG